MTRWALKLLHGNQMDCLMKEVHNNARIKVKFKDSSVTLENCLFGAVKLTKIADIDKANILYMVSGLIQNEVSNIQVEDTVKMLLSSELI